MDDCKTVEDWVKGPVGWGVGEGGGRSEREGGEENLQISRIFSLDQNKTLASFI
jgi:hypothetical protein